MRPQPRVQNKKAHEHSHHGHTGITRHSPRNGFNGFLRALPGDRACLPPSPAEVDFRELDASVGASGPHDFAVRIRRRSSIAPPASTASRPASVTIASRPSVGRDGGRYRFDLGQAESGIFLRKGLDRQSTDLPVGQISRPIRRSSKSYRRPGTRSTPYTSAKTVRPPGVSRCSHWQLCASTCAFGRCSCRRN